ncbi:NH(3)-dependent NAD(+) synthetase [Patiriisocius marinistellae]|uniref:NH(3)-dependent NAD(+) synthetase n=1 Tax=Patiriisocius marinistellae TaxID=2494560 RepID=A0A5J4FXH2_9FLAO|nr:NAD(+) synthase [Patiriisocius marinistellae]GEQ86950.1 NH(3)-dependent NAD(+) synthetase [Patiriisocius marinistellae]
MHTEKVTNHIVNWLKEYAQKAGMDGFVVGVSGGIDSAVTSTLCAMTGLRTLCVTMPIHQAKSQVTRGDEHIAQLKKRFLNVTNVEVNLTPTFESFKSQVPFTADDTFLDLSLANTRARLRMTTLYYFAGLHRYLVAGTGNKVEDFGVGFYTKYGDGGVDLSPIADLMKSEVYAIGAHIEVQDSILKAAPTDGLFGDSRTDEDQIGASYDELEWAMQMVDVGKNIDDFTGRKKEVFDIYTRLNRANQHKMNPIPVCEIPSNLRK